EARSLFENDSLAAAAHAHAAPALESASLIPGETLRDARRRRLLTAAAALGLLAAVKIIVSLQRGHANVALLFVEAAIFGVIACRLTIRHRTPAGDRALVYL